MHANVTGKISNIIAIKIYYSGMIHCNNALKNCIIYYSFETYTLNYLSI